MSAYFKFNQLMMSGDINSGKCKEDGCRSPQMCKKRLQELINTVTDKVNSSLALEDPNSAQSMARDWILKECDADPPIDPCDESGINLIEQRYALAVLYFSLGGDDWYGGANPGQDPSAPAGKWLSGLNFCNWAAWRLDCDEDGNAVTINLCEYVSKVTKGFFIMLSSCQPPFLTLISLTCVI